MVFLSGVSAQTVLTILSAIGGLLGVISALYLGMRKLRVDARTVEHAKTKAEVDREDARTKAQNDRDARFIETQERALKETQDKVEYLEQRARLLETDIAGLRKDNVAKDEQIARQEREIANCKAEVATARERITELERRNRILEESYRGQEVLEGRITTIHQELERLLHSGTGASS